LVLLAGRPKIGKSWLLLQVACGVTTGGKLFDKDIEQGEVLFLALEDNPRRIKNRCTKMNIPLNAPIQFEFNWRPLHQGGLDDLYIAIMQDRYRMIAIDTLARSLPGVNHNDENPIGPIMDELQKLAINHGITILPSDHTRKSSGILIDPIDDVMGSTSKSRSLDSVLALYKEQGKAGAVLKGRGRETEELDLALTFDVETCCWQSQGNAGELKENETRTAILEYIESFGKSQCATVANGIGKPRSKVFQHMQTLIGAGKIRREEIEGKVFYDDCRISAVTPVTTVTTVTVVTPVTDTQTQLEIDV
jgi:RecA-family ATPase